MSRSKRLSVPPGCLVSKCFYCFADITDVRVKCVECADFELCLQCFSCGAEIGKHKSQHKYALVDCGNFPLFKTQRSTWTSQDEVKLLLRIGRYGYGNWKEVAEHLNNGYSAEDVRNHYDEMYVQGNIGAVTWKIDEPLVITDHTEPENGPLSPSLTNPVLSPEIPIQLQRELGYMPRRDDFEREFDNEAETLISGLEFSNQEEEPEKRPLSPSLTNPVLSPEIPIQLQRELGYMPRRDDFEREFDNEAETLISGLEFSNQEEEPEKSFKLAQINMYNDRLRKRFLMKKLARQHNKVQDFFNSSNKAKSPVPKKKYYKRDCGSFLEFRKKMQLFARFFTETELREFYENLRREKELKIKILELIKLRKCGITNFEDAKEADFTKYKLEKTETKLKPGAGRFPKKASMVLRKGGEKEKIGLLGKKGQGDKWKFIGVKYIFLPSYSSFISY